jgi:hypothetical protein
VSAKPMMVKPPASLIEIETLKRRISIIEQGIMNVEGMCSVNFIKMTEHSESKILDHFSQFGF